MIIDNINTDEKVFVIAEIGNNHEGSYSLAEEMIGLAAKSGADAVKFQTIVPERLVSVLDVDRIKQLRKFQFEFKDFEKLSRVAKNEGIVFLSTPFDIESAAFLEPLVPAFKISSGDNTFYPLLEQVASSCKPIILSTGLSDLNQVGSTKDFIERIWTENGISPEIALLHCVANYPTDAHNANLGCIKKLSETFGVTVGYSDHTLGIEAAVLSVSLGARIVEKHFTINKNHSDFHDHKLSADPKDMAILTDKLKQVISMMGSSSKPAEDCEKEIRIKLRRSVVAKNDMSDGSVITFDDLDWVRPGGGVDPGKENQIVGKSLKRNILKGEKILIDDVR